MIGGVWVKLWVFVLRLSHSGKAVHVAYAIRAQPSAGPARIARSARQLRIHLPQHWPR